MRTTFGIAFFCLWTCAAVRAEPPVAFLSPSAYGHYIERFNQMEDEPVVNYISNAESWTWLKRNIPLFECPDKEFEQIYYYRWWTYRKHIKATPVGFVVTEFIMPVNWAGIYNTISCAFGHHVAEGRWLADQRILDDYTRFWFRGNHGKRQPHFHDYSNWAHAAVYERFLVNRDRPFVQGLLDDLIADYQAWEEEHQTESGLFWQFDAFLTYVRSHVSDGKPYIAEYLDETTGQWIRESGHVRHYNHSTFADLLITGLIGLRPRADDIVEVHPLLPENAWDWFCIDGISYRDRRLTIVWDANGQRYGGPPGLQVFADGRRIAHLPRLQQVRGRIADPLLN